MSSFRIRLSHQTYGYTPASRREAGSYSSDVKGLNRVHQFDKVEIVQFQHPDHSDKALLEMVEHVAGILDELGLPYRIVRLCGGDLATLHPLPTTSKSFQRPNKVAGSRFRFQF